MLAPTAVLRRYGWDASLKAGEHFAYFYAHLGKIRVGYTEVVSVHHEPARNPFYEQYRGLASGTSGSSCAVTASAAASISPATWSRPDGGDLPVDSWSRDSPL
jgi:hypothetical protein